MKRLLALAALFLFCLPAPVAAQSDTTAVALTSYISDSSCNYTTGALTLENVESTALYATQVVDGANADLSAPLFYQVDLGTADSVRVRVEASTDRTTWHTVTSTDDIVADTWYASTANGVKAARFIGFQIGGTAVQGTTGTVTLNIKIPLRDGVRSECWTINASR